MTSTAFLQPVPSQITIKMNLTYDTDYVVNDASSDVLPYADYADPSAVNNAATESDALPCAPQQLINETWVRAVIISFYLVIFALGFFGNLLVILVVARNRAMQTPTNIFIVNMALSDVLMCLFAVPFTPLHSFMDSWVFGAVLCKLFPTSQVSVAFKSISCDEIPSS